MNVKENKVGVINLVEKFSCIRDDSFETMFHYLIKQVLQIRQIHISCAGNVVVLSETVIYIYK